MARTVTIVDDLDGSSPAETVSFSLGHFSYEIDLSEVNAQRLADALKEFTDAARPAPRSVSNGVRPAKAPKAERRSREQLAAIRRWGRENGWEVSNFGRVPEQLLEAFEKAHQR